MSTFTVPIKRVLAIEPHPNADALEFAVIDGYRSIIRKGQLKAGDPIAYIPEAAVVPQWILRRLGLWDEERGKGKLNGKQGDRVKAARLRGELSQGICYPARGESDCILLPGEDQDYAVAEGDNVADRLGIVKYEPPIPVHLAGEVFNAGAHLTIAFDVENWKSHPEIIQAGEEVIFTEKIHGTFTGIAILPYKDAHPEAFGEKRNILIFSKNLGSRGLVFKNNERNTNNLYVRSTRSLIEQIDRLQCEDGHAGPSVPNFILGETYGTGVQDLTYGEEIGFRVFASAYGYRGSQSYYNWQFVEGTLKYTLGFETVPVLYRGPFEKSLLQRYTSGNSVLGGGHIREGVVILPRVERTHDLLGRVCLKSISADYLTRRNGTEYN